MTLLMNLLLMKMYLIHHQKVKSGVIRLVRKENYQDIPVSEKFLKSIVKTAFGQRRKTLRNSLKVFGLSDELRKTEVFAKRPEQLSVSDFMDLAITIKKDKE